MFKIRKSNVSTIPITYIVRNNNDQVNKKYIFDNDHEKRNNENTFID